MVQRVYILIFSNSIAQLLCECVEESKGFLNALEGPPSVMSCCLKFAIKRFFYFFFVLKKLPSKFCLLTSTKLATSQNLYKVNRALVLTSNYKPVYLGIAVSRYQSPVSTVYTTQGSVQLIS